MSQTGLSFYLQENFYFIPNKGNKDSKEAQHCLALSMLMLCGTFRLDSWLWRLEKPEIVLDMKSKELVTQLAFFHKVLKY